jgi:hypothetical protein
MLSIRRFDRQACRLRFTAISLCVIWAFELPAPAQDTFHVPVHEYEPLQPRELHLELHANYVGRGTKSSSAFTAATNNQLHTAHELTAGIAPGISLGGMLLTGKRAGNGLEYAGLKVLPHFYAPRSWNLPLDVGIVAEFSFIKTAFDENPRSVEIHPVLEKRFRNWIFDANPGLERMLKGPDKSEGWKFQSALRARYEVADWFTPGVEYYRESSRFNHVVVGSDIKLGTQLSWSLGIGFGPTPAGNHLVYTSVIKFEFAGQDNHHR